MKLKFTLVIATLLICFNLTAQTKTGTVNSAYIIGSMPQMEKVLERTKNYSMKLDSSFQIKLTAFRKTLTAYQKVEKTLSDLDKNKRSAELSTLEKELDQFRKNGSQLLQLRRNEYMRPLYKKLDEVISQIAKENGYAQILTINGNQFAYFDEKYDITQKVLDKLGIKGKK